MVCCDVNYKDGILWVLNFIDNVENKVWVYSISFFIFNMLLIVNNLNVIYDDNLKRVLFGIMIFDFWLLNKYFGRYYLLKVIIN